MSTQAYCASITSKTSQRLSLRHDSTAIVQHQDQYRPVVQPTQRFAYLNTALSLIMSNLRKCFIKCNKRNCF